MKTNDDKCYVSAPIRYESADHFSQDGTEHLWLPELLGSILPDDKVKLWVDIAKHLGCDEFLDAYFVSNPRPSGKIEKIKSTLHWLAAETGYKFDIEYKVYIEEDPESICESWDILPHCYEECARNRYEWIMLTDQKNCTKH